MKNLKWLFLGMLVLGFAGAAFSQEVPENCTGSAMNVELTPSNLYYVHGETVQYVIDISVGASACDACDVDVYFFPPDITPNGATSCLSDNGIPIVTGLYLPQGGSIQLTSSNDVSLAYTVDHADEDPAHRLFAYVCVTFVARTDPNLPDDSSRSSVNNVIHPAIQIEKSADPCNICEGEPGTEVTYTYEVSWGEYDTGIPGDARLEDVVVTDDNCSPVTYDSGDDGDLVLESGETWIYECITTLTQATTNTAVVEANSVRRGVYVSDEDTAEVTADNPVCEDFTGDLEPDCDTTGNTLSISATGGVPPYGYSWTSSDDGNWPITGPTDTDTITYDSGPPGSSTEFCVDINDALDCNVQCCIVIDCAPPPGDMFCSFTQGFWGNKNGKFEGQTTKQLLDEYFTTETLTIGAGSNQVTLSDTTCLLKRMPAGGTPRCLDGLGIVDDDCGSSASEDLEDWLKKGNAKGARYNNVLMGQVIALTLNVWLDPNLGGLPLASLEGGFCTQGEDPEDWQCFDFPDDLDPVDVDGLLVLANSVLGCANGASISDIYDAVTAINEGFDECRTLVPCDEVCYDGIDNDCNSLTLDCGGGDCPDPCP